MVAGQNTHPFLSFPDRNRLSQIATLIQAPRPGQSFTGNVRAAAKILLFRAESILPQSVCGLEVKIEWLHEGVIFPSDEVAKIIIDHSFKQKVHQILDLLFKGSPFL